MPKKTGVLGSIVEKDVPAPMRDGVVLRANVFRPDASGTFPGLLLRTPYGKHYGAAESANLERLQRYVRAGYAVVVQDTRGRYASEGNYIPFYVENTGDAEDGYDTVEWLAQQPYCNGKVGTMGHSYNAWMQWMLAKLRPQHLVAMCATSIPVEQTELYCQGGIFRPGRQIKWWMTNLAPDLRRRQGLAGPHTPEEAEKIWNEVEQGLLLGLIPWIELPRYLPEGLSEYIEDWLKNTNRIAWKFSEAHKEIEVPNLDISGWYDHCNGSIGHLAGMQKNARTEVARKQTKLILGSWNHGVGKRKTGEVDFGQQAEIDLDGMKIRWFDYWLKGLDNGIDHEPSVRYFVMGSNKWKSTNTWPPNKLDKIVYYLGSSENTNNACRSGVLALELRKEEPCDSYNYDPRNPVSTLWGRNFIICPYDRKLLEYREDILYYCTPPLDQEIEVVGYPEVVLYASSSATDTDFFARLVDETPDGPALEISHGAVRARYRNSFEHEELLVPGEVTEFRIKLGATACRFFKSHRICLEITSSDFPHYDRNHNTGGNDLAETEMVTAQQKIFHSLDYPSSLILSVAE